MLNNAVASKSDPEALTGLIRDALEQAVREAIEEHHRAGNPVAIWRDGQVVLWYPDGSYRPVDARGGG